MRGMEGEREREGRRDGGMEGWEREGERMDGGREGGREGGRKGGERGREREGEGEREGGRDSQGGGRKVVRREDKCTEAEMRNRREMKSLPQLTIHADVAHSCRLLCDG